jgi:hypothetical protein
MANNYKTELNKAYQRGIAKQLEVSDRLLKIFNRQLGRYKVTVLEYHSRLKIATLVLNS